GAQVSNRQAGQVILQPVPSSVPATSLPLTSWVTLNRSSSAEPWAWAVPTNRLGISWFWPARKAAPSGINATSGGSAKSCRAFAIFTASRDFAVFAASAQVQVEAKPNQVRAVGTRPDFFLMASTNSATCGTLGWFQYHSNTQVPMRASGG